MVGLWALSLPFWSDSPLSSLLSFFFFFRFPFFQRTCTWCQKVDGSKGVQVFGVAAKGASQGCVRPTYFRPIILNSHYIMYGFQKSTLPSPPAVLTPPHPMYLSAPGTSLKSRAKASWLGFEAPNSGTIGCRTWPFRFSSWDGE